MLLTTKVGAAIVATAAASFVAGATLHTPQLSVRDTDRQVRERQAQPAPVIVTANRAAKQDRLDMNPRAMARRTACLAQNWLQLSPDCIELFVTAARDIGPPRTTTVVVREGTNTSVAIRVPRPESEHAFR